VGYGNTVVKCSCEARNIKRKPFRTLVRRSKGTVTSLRWCKEEIKKVENHEPSSHLRGKKIKNEGRCGIGVKLNQGPGGNRKEGTLGSFSRVE